MEIAEILKLRQNANGLNKLMNMHVITLDKDGGATVEVELTDELLNPLGMAHGGTIFTLCDIAAGSAAASQGTVAVTLDSSINYPTLRNIRDGKEMKKATERFYLKLFFDLINKEYERRMACGGDGAVSLLIVMKNILEVELK